MGIERFTVTGMSCDHCVRAVTSEVATLPGVERVDVDLATGIVTVETNRALDRDEVAAAVDEAGYELVRE